MHSHLQDWIATVHSLSHHTSDKYAMLEPLRDCVYRAGELLLFNIDIIRLQNVTVSAEADTTAPEDLFRYLAPLLAGRSSAAFSIVSALFRSHIVHLRRHRSVLFPVKTGNVPKLKDVAMASFHSFASICYPALDTAIAWTAVLELVLIVEAEAVFDATDLLSRGVFEDLAVRAVSSLSGLCHPLISAC